MGDHYETLGVSRNAPAKVISVVYRALMREAHSDVTGGDDAAAIRLNEAHDVLSNSAKRAEYDRKLAAAEAAVRAEAERRARQASEPQQATFHTRYEGAATAHPNPQYPAAPPRTAPPPAFVWPKITPWWRRPIVGTWWAIWTIVAIIMLAIWVAVSWPGAGIALLLALVLCVTAYCFGTGSRVPGTLALCGAVFFLVVLTVLQVGLSNIELAIAERSAAPIPTGSLAPIGIVVLLFVLSLAAVAPAIERARQAEAGDIALAQLDEFDHIQDHVPHLAIWLVKTAARLDSSTAVELEWPRDGREMNAFLEDPVGVGDLLLLNSTSKPVRHLSKEVASRALRRRAQLGRA